MSNFLSLLDSISSCRKAGFVREALIAALCVPDACRKAVAPSVRYSDWCRQNGCFNTKLFSSILYPVRNSSVHNLKPGEDVIFDFSDNATAEYPEQEYYNSLQLKINAGKLIEDILDSGRNFYNSSNTSIKRILDNVDKNIVYFILR